MMNKQIAALVLAISVVGGIGAGIVVNAVTHGTPSTTKPAPSTTATATPASDSLTIAPGAVGPVTVGMSAADALATGYFVAGTKTDEGCPDLPLVWKEKYVDDLGVYTLGNGEIVSIGIRRDGVTTADGIGVGSTYNEVAATYPEEALVEAGYGQSGVRVFDEENGGWIGFLFDPAPDLIEGIDPVTFVEVTKGTEPSLMRDGC